MMKKRWIALSLAAAMFFGSFSGSVAAAVKAGLDGQAQQKVLEQIVPEVREKLGVPEALNGFNSEYAINPDGDIFYLRWYKGDDMYGNDAITATVNPAGEIINYYVRRDYGGESKHFPALSKAEAEAKAQEYLLKAVPELVDQIGEAVITYQPYDGYQVMFTQMLNDIPVVGNTINLSIDADTGNLNGIYRSWSYSSFKNIEKQEKLISVEQAQKALQEKIGLKLHYRLNYDYSGGNEPTVVLEYAWNNSASSYIDAKSGEIYVQPNYYDYLSGGKGGGSVTMAMNQMAVEEDAARLTPQEIERIEALEGFLSSQEAEKIVRAMTQLDLDDTMKLTSASYSKGYSDKKDYIYLQFDSSDEKVYRYASATVDAKTGELQSFYSSSNKPQQFGASKIGDEKRDSLQKQAASFLTATAPELSKQTAWDESNTGNDNNGVTFTYVRLVNDIPFEGNAFSISINPDSQKVSHFYRNWQDDLSFPAPENVISVDEAYQKLFALSAPELSYIPHMLLEDAHAELGSYEYDARLIYSIGTAAWLSVDAFEGELLEYGLVYQPNTEFAGYVDIEGHESAEQIAAVAEFFGLKGDEEFRPDDQITQAELLRLLYSLAFYGNYSGNDDAMYRELIMYGYLNESEKEPEQKLIAADGAKYLVKVLGMERYAQMSGIYKNPLNLNATDAAYVALAAGVKAVDLKNFDAKATLTRAGAMELIHSYLSR